MPPFMPVPVVRPFKTRYGVRYCPDCDLALVYCKCATTPPPDPADARAQADMARRVKEHLRSR